MKKNNHHVIHFYDKKLLGEVAMWLFNRNELFLLLIEKIAQILEWPTFFFVFGINCKINVL